ncbi:MAG: hypothetical protein A3B37_00525 [Candidatus Sungbacteria bacterium RIFCSPLOWO2_01_FULL_59_16]|uniref:Carrier domain-containing protein n=1 Tax=Candidatus Sungbacteria bacterium RIFCSPLOWO2_01_FULL_59_16 TaxID=1802280 RepID=A0A1G2LDB4_9BACT|nr:MAG: hypothetical protein A3B37_00525 [Candidatus Sungbacteria bacterium RIFCSPLOWO2_01_FULL_59_16]
MDVVGQAVREIVGRYAGIAPENLNLNAVLEELGIDSLDTSEIILEFEERLDLSIPDEDRVFFSEGTVGTVIAHLHAELFGGRGPRRPERVSGG